MELERAIITFVLQRLVCLDAIELKVTLETALKLIDKLNVWDAKEALGIIFGLKEDNADAE